MQSILIISKNNGKIEKQIKSLTRDIEQLDLNIVDYQSNPIDSKNKNSIGINEVRNFQKKLYFKPLKSKEKAVVLKNCENLTVEAQNALLKVLEEPPANTTIILTASSANSFLPTVLSRCKIIELEKENSSLSEKETSQYFNILISLISSKVGERLKLAQDLSKNKEDALSWLEKMILTVRHILLFSFSNTSNSNNKEHFSLLTSHFSLPQRRNLSVSQYVNILMSLTQTHTVLSTTNANPRLVLENLFLNLQS